MRPNTGSQSLCIRQSASSEAGNSFLQKRSIPPGYRRIIQGKEYSAAGTNENLWKDILRYAVDLKKTVATLYSLARDIPQGKTTEIAFGAYRDSLASESKVREIQHNLPNSSSMTEFLIQQMIAHTGPHPSICNCIKIIFTEHTITSLIKAKPVRISEMENTGRNRDNSQ